MVMGSNIEDDSAKEIEKKSGRRRIKKKNVLKTQRGEDLEDRVGDIVRYYSEVKKSEY